MSELRADGKPPGFSVNFRMAADLRHQVRTVKIDRGRTAAVAVIHRLRGSSKHIDPEYRHLVVVIGRVLPGILIHLLWGRVLTGSRGLVRMGRSGIHRRSRIILRIDRDREHECCKQQKRSFSH